jgi:CHAD domain-containing protein
MPEAPSPAALKAEARSQLRSLAVALGKTRPGHSVHGARRQIKRLRSLLRLLRDSMGEDAFAAANGALRAAADALAGQRRAEALVVAAGRLGGSTRRARAPWQTLAEAHREAHAGETAADGGLEAARRAIAEAARTVRGCKLKRGSAPAIGKAFLATYRRARKWLERGFASGQAEDIHTARKHVIHHLHHLGLLSAHLSDPARRLSALEKLREALGDLNDLDELNQLASAGSPPPEPAVKAMEKRRAVLIQRAEKVAREQFPSR